MNTTIPRVRPWRHELAGCLHACAGTLLEFHGVDPLDALGSAWRFWYPPGDVRREEFYYPCAPGESLFATLAPNHDVVSEWHCPQDEREAWVQVRDRVLDGEPIAVAVDNFHLPFRPAYHDVHTNHLIVLYGIDERRGKARVLDEVPPRFDGEIELAELAAARHSVNPIVHGRDKFFTANPIAGRWLSVRATASPPYTVDDRERISALLRANIERFNQSQADVYSGLSGQARFLTEGARRLDTDPAAKDELFVVAGTALATTAIHADWLARVGRLLEKPGLVEVARLVQRLAHHWSAVRIVVGADRGGAALARRASALSADHGAVLDRLAAELDEWGR
jgi:hypothetical protein